MDQLPLVPEHRASFVPTCATCGAQGPPIPVHEGQQAFLNGRWSWNAASKWAYVELKRHEREMHA